TESSQMRFSKRAPSATHTSWPLSCCFISRRHRPTSTLFPYTTLFRSRLDRGVIGGIGIHRGAAYRSPVSDVAASPLDRDADVEALAGACRQVAQVAGQGVTAQGAAARVRSIGRLPGRREVVGDDDLASVGGAGVRDSDG